MQIKIGGMQGLFLCATIFYLRMMTTEEKKLVNRP